MAHCVFNVLLSQDVQYVQAKMYAQFVRQDIQLIQQAIRVQHVNILVHLALQEPQHVLLVQHHFLVLQEQTVFASPARFRTVLSVHKIMLVHALNANHLIVC